MSRKDRRAQQSGKLLGPFVQAFNRGLALQQAGQLEEAAAAYRKAMPLNPNVALLHNNLGVVLYHLGQLEEAIACQRRAIALEPGLAMAHNNLGVALNSLGLHAEAMPEFSRAIQLEPTNAQAINNLGDSHVKLSHFEEAAALLERAVNLAPNYVEAHTNLGAAYWGLGRLDEALACFRRAIALQPDLAMAHKNFGIVSLLAGHYAEGWSEYEWRWVADKVQRRNHPRPIWQGQDLGDGKLLVLAEQGAGDQVLHASMMADLVGRGLKVVWEVDERLVKLLQRSCPEIKVVSRRLPPAIETISQDVAAHIDAGSLGLHLRNGASAFPTHRRSYLKADGARAQSYRAALGLSPREKLIGISWLSKHPDYGQSKSTALAAWADILKTPGARFVDLQYGDTEVERAEVARTLGLEVAHIDGLDLFNDLDGVAALAEACDLVVTVSNTTAHIAAALGKPVWILMPAGLGKFWYWGFEGTTTPWYPAAQLIRQGASQDWAPILKTVTLQLAGFLADGLDR